jgi:hypothetical protein
MSNEKAFRSEGGGPANQTWPPMLTMFISLMAMAFEFLQADACK